MYTRLLSKKVQLREKYGSDDDVKNECVKEGYWLARPVQRSAGYVQSEILDRCVQHKYFNANTFNGNGTLLPIFHKMHSDVSDVTYHQSTNPGFIFIGCKVCKNPVPSYVQFYLSVPFNGNIIKM